MKESDAICAARIKSVTDKAYSAGMLSALAYACETIEITGVDFDPPYTTVHWANGDSTTVRDQEYVKHKEQFDLHWHELGICCALCKRVAPDFADTLRKWVPKKPQKDWW